jgi:hypothetical protein
MKRKFVAALIVALAVLFGQGGGLVLAAFCPHVKAEQPDNACHDAQEANSQDAVTEHHQTAVPEGHAFESKESDVRCNHCVVNSRSKREESVLQTTYTPQRADDQKSAVHVYRVEHPSFLKISTWSAQTHGPPGPPAPLHVLLNVFRI